MPLSRDIHISPDVRLCIWQIGEVPDEPPCPAGVDLSGLHSPSRRREVQAVYALLAYMTGRNDLVIGHDDTGRPVLKGWQMSISHTRGWAALIMSRSKHVAIDIEYMSDRVSRVADRFIRKDEQRGSLGCQLINWSAKETVFKYLSEEHLEYFEMRLKPFQPSAQGVVEVEDLRLPKTITVAYEHNADYVLTYAIGK